MVLFIASPIYGGDCNVEKTKWALAQKVWAKAHFVSYLNPAINGGAMDEDKLQLLKANWHRLTCRDVVLNRISERTCLPAGRQECDATDAQ